MKKIIPFIVVLTVLIFILILLLNQKPRSYFTKKHTIYDNIIIGGGVSGAYLAYNLTKMGKNVLLLESSSDVGGRLMSYPIDNALSSKSHNPVKGGKIALEYGGMRFFPEHTIVNNLVNNVFKDTLKAVKVPYYTSKGTIYLRGNKIKGEPNLIKKTIKDVYNIIGENGTSVLTQTNTVPFDFFTQFIRDPEFNKIWKSKYKNNPPDLNNFAELDSDQKNKIIDILISEPIFRDVGAGDFIIRKLNEYVSQLNGIVTGSVSEYIDSYIDTQGYSLFTLLPAGITVLEDIDVLASKGQFFLENGYKTLVKALIDNCDQKYLTMKLNTSVNNVKVNDDNTFNVELGSNKGVLHSKNILNTATPNRCMDWSINTNYKKLFNSVHPIITMKIFIQFKKIWWDSSSDSGKHVTTLPFRQVWMYNNDPPIVMIYCDSDDAKFFRGMVPVDKKTDMISPDTKSISDLVLNLNSLFKQMFQNYTDNNILKLGWAYLDPCSYFWNIRADIKGCMNEASNPEPGYYMAGDTWSIRQAWVQGALESCDRVLEKYK